MSPTPTEDFSLKDIFLRMEASFQQQLSQIREDIHNYQATTVTKAEFTTQMEGLRRDLDRVDRQGKDGNKEISDRLEQQLKSDREEWKETRRQDKADLMNRMMLFIGAGGFVVGIIEFVVRLLVK